MKYCFNLVKFIIDFEDKTSYNMLILINKNI